MSGRRSVSLRAEDLRHACVCVPVASGAMDEAVLPRGNETSQQRVCLVRSDKGLRGSVCSNPLNKRDVTHEVHQP